jgi:hypothetical protein
MPNVPYARKSFRTHWMELLGDVGHGVSCFGLFRDGVSVVARSFWTKPMELQVMWLMWNLILFCSVMVLVSEQDRCKV